MHRVSHCTYFSNSLSLFTERIKIGKPETVGHKQKKILESELPTQRFLIDVVIVQLLVL